MNTINNTFSFRRLWAVMKCDLVVNRKRYIGVFFLMFVAFLGYQLFEIRNLIEMCQYHATHPVTPETSGFEPELCMAILARTSCAIFYYISVLALAYTATEMYSAPVRTKMKAINYFTRWQVVMPTMNLPQWLKNRKEAAV